MKPFSNLVLIASFFTLPTGGALAQASVSAKPNPDAIRLSGCPVQISDSCIMLLDARGTPYDITGAPAWASVKTAKQALLSHRSIRLTGTVAEGAAGSCRRGVVLKDIRWSYSAGKCQSPTALEPRKP